MKKLLGIMAVVALLAAPAMAANPDIQTVDVNLEIETYVELTLHQASITIVLANNQTTNDGHIWGDVRCNAPSTLTAAIAKVGTGPETWSIHAASLSQSFGAGYTPGFGVGVTVVVPVFTAPQAAIHSATVTLTLASP